MTLLQTWLDYVDESKKPAPAQELSPSALPPSCPLPHMYFVSTSLNIHEAEETQATKGDIHLEGTCYRIVTPDYYAWLHRRMEAAKRQHQKGTLASEAWDKLRERFNRVQAWTINHYGADALQQAIHRFKPDAYQPPVNRPTTSEPQSSPLPPVAPRLRYPATGEYTFEHPVTAEAVRKVDAIRDEAETLGWAEARLYQNRGCIAFPCGQDWGLVCFIGPNDALGKITETHIEIIHNRHGRKNTLRFANADAWTPRIKAKGTSP